MSKMLVSRSTIFYRKILCRPVIYRKFADQAKPATTQTPTKPSLQQASEQFLNNPFIKHLAGGAASGLVTGYVIKSIGRTPAIIAGTGIIAFEIAKYKGAVPASMDPMKMAGDVGNKYGRQSTELVNKVKLFAGKNKVFTAAFVGGFLIGVAI